ncbi:MAG: alcohol dehydrogenase [Blautia sp.]|nr:alcohol dehydrogenase [Blautia sp.]
MIAHAYYDFFAEKKASEENMIKMAKAMGVENASSGKDFIAVLDKLIEDVGCADLKMSEEGITKEELKQYPAKVHEVLGGDITADPVSLSDEDYLAIFENAWK